MAASCAILGLPRASYYRSLNPTEAADLAPEQTPGPAPASYDLAPATTAEQAPGPAPAGDDLAPATTAEQTPGPAPAGHDLAPATTAEQTPGPAPAGHDFARAALAGYDPEPTTAEQAPAGSLAAGIMEHLSPNSATGRALTAAERQRILDVLHSERFIDRAPAEVVHTLAAEGIYLASISTFYRILNKEQEVKERRAQRRHPIYAKPQLIATAPNQVWSWDITKLLGPAKWTYYYLYVLLDIYSRYVVAWMLAHREVTCLAKQLIQAGYENQGIEPGQLSVHSDNGPIMRAKPVVSLHAQLGIIKSNSRPHVSNDNPFSESNFKTLKYGPGFPSRFGGYEDALRHCNGFFPWYNQEHRHSGIEFLTPEQVHYGLADVILARCYETKMAAYEARPERFINGPPKLAELSGAVYINPPERGGESKGTTQNSSTDLSQTP